MESQMAIDAFTAAVQSRIDDCAAQGGGRVEIPPGLWICGSIQLRSGVELHLAHGARLRASDDPCLYKPVGANDPSVTANSKLCAFLWATKATDIAVTGSGVLDGGGDPENTPDWKTAQDMFRPALVYLEGCRRVRIETIRIVGAKWWTLHLRRCQDIFIRGISMRSTWPNTDGIDPDGCRNLLISDCHLVCGDDCIVFKSTQGDANEDAVVTNCVLETEKACLKLGTESFGDFRNIVMSNCVLCGDVGFGLYLKDGGVMENVRAMNLVFDTQSAWPVLIDAMARDYRSGKSPGHIRNISLSHCSFRGPGRIWIEGCAEQPLENIRLLELDWYVTDGLAEDRSGKPLGSARVVVDPERPRYQDSPAQVLAIHTKGFSLEGLRLQGPDAARPLLECFGLGCA
jgi:hypothetical protein